MHDVVERQIDVAHAPIECWRHDRDVPMNHRGKIRDESQILRGQTGEERLDHRQRFDQQRVERPCLSGRRDVHAIERAVQTSG